MKRNLILLINILLFSMSMKAQSTDTLRVSLVEAVNIAVKNNPQLKSVQLDEEINKFKIKEIKSGALPQLSGSGSFNDNYSLASQILPGEVFGQPGTSVAVKFGTQYTYGMSANLTQKLFDPSLYTGLKAAKAGQGFYELSTFKNKEDLIYNVVNVYMQIEMTGKQMELIEGNIGRMIKLVEITDAQYKEGIIKKVDVDQLRVNSTNLRTQLSTSNNTYMQLMNNLKILMNEDVYRPLAITNEVGAKPIPVSEQLFLKDNTDLALINYQILLQGLNTDNIKAGYLPSLSAFANYGKQWQSNYLFKSGAASGFASGALGLTLNVPIFDGFAKRNKIAQSDLQVKQLKINAEFLTRKITNDFVNAKNNLNQNKDVLSAQAENMKLAEELYNVAKLSYTEGISPLSELINAENGLKEAQTQYLTALLQMNLAELDLMKSSGQLSKVIKGN